MSEKTIQYVESVKEVSEAWVYIMSVLDEFERPEIHITPRVIYDVSSLHESTREELFEVTVRGLVNA